MTTKGFRERLLSGRLSRRDIGRGLAASGLTLIALPLRTACAAAKDVVLFGWQNYDAPELHKAYTEKYGTSPQFTVFADEEEGLVKLRAGFRTDVTMPCSYKVRRWNEAGVLAPIEESRLSNWSNVIESLKTIPDTVIDGKRYWVPLDWGQTSITYRTDLVDIEEESWSLLWDQRYAGKLSMIDSLIDGVAVAAIHAGVDPFDMNDDDIAKVKEALVKQRPLLRFYAGSMTDVEQALAAGELVAAATWNDSYRNLTKQGLPVKFMRPKEGAMTWTCGLALASTVANLQEAHDLIDAMIDPRSGAYEIDEFGYGSANRKAFDLVSEAVLAERGLTRNPDDLLKSGIFQRAMKNEEKIQKMFEAVKAGT